MKHGFKGQGFFQHPSKFIFILITGFACAWINSAVATEVYTWTDSDGVVHYGDAPPDSGESKKVEVEDAYRPGTASTNPLPEDSEPSPSATAETGAEEDLRSVAQKRRDQIAESRKENREAQAKNEQMCARHRQRLAQVEPARRVYITDENGESVRMDDDARLNMVEESKDYIAKNCE